MGKGDKINIVLTGGPPWGFRLGGGSDFGCPLEIAKLRKKSKASEAGLEEGDVVIKIDHHDVSSKSHGDAMKIIELCGPSLSLDVIKGLGPSAGLVSTSTMAEPIFVNSSDGLASQNSTQPLEVTVVRSREPSIARSYTEPVRERSVSRNLAIVSGVSQKVESRAQSVTTSANQNEPWTVDVTSFKFASTLPAPLPKPQPEKQTLAPAQLQNSKEAPPTSPKPKFKATAPASNTSVSSCPVLPTWGVPPTDPQLKHVWNPSFLPQPTEIDNAMSSTSLFKVTKIDAKPEKWQPTPTQNTDFFNPKHRFNKNEELMQSSDRLVATTPSKQSDLNRFTEIPINHSIPEPPPLPAAQMSPRKPPNHVPGMINPLIYDDSQGDFGANPIVRPSKKIYSDSAFYDAPGMQYPTIHEQVALCKEIASFLESSQNNRSRGGRMFMKRKQRADEWSMDGQGQRSESSYKYETFNDYNDGMTKPTYHPMERREVGYGSVRHHPNPIKSKLNAAELEQIQHDREALCKHDSLPPNVAFDINYALNQSGGKAGQIFEKRRQRVEKYIVDENSNNAWNPSSRTVPAQSDFYSSQMSYASPWQPAPGNKVDYGSQKRSTAQLNMGQVQMQPLNPINNYQNYTSPQTDTAYKTFRSVVPPSSQTQGHFIKSPPSYDSPKPRTRLDLMLADAESKSTPFIRSTAPNSFDAGNSYAPMKNSYYQSNDHINHMSPVATIPDRTSNTTQMSSSFTANLRRPKEYISQNSSPRHIINMGGASIF